MGRDRRAFLRGQWSTDGAPPPAASSEIASILVQTRPERLAGAEQAIAAIAGTEIHGRDPKGKLVVVIEATDVGAIGATLNEIALMPDVISASLVFHATDAG